MTKSAAKGIGLRVPSFAYMSLGAYRHAKAAFFKRRIFAEPDISASEAKAHFVRNGLKDYLQVWRIVFD
ncbi:hypothetical protein [uncultured Cohaesibacter sp.]|uniref:hypothetical protein n=1 Tax=uncultured Cohaesibacter sp. TaxID=1002546 RepID=UPI0029C732A0|nr:hypothetical protein [uncultured Cohaesibacter sp.]